LVIGMDLDSLPDACASAAVTVLAINAAHVLAEAVPVPATRDPFDRLLLAQAQVEGMRIITIDRALGTPALAWRPTSP